MTVKPPGLRLARGTVSPEREEIARRADEFEIEIRRARRRALALWSFAMMLLTAAFGLYGWLL